MKRISFVAAAFLLASPMCFAQEELTDKQRAKLEAASASDDAPADTAVVPAPKPAPQPTAAPAPAVPQAQPAQAEKPAAGSDGNKPPLAAPAAASPEPVAQPKPTPVSSVIDASVGDELSPLPVAIISTVNNTCMPSLLGTQALSAGLPPDSENGASEETLKRFIASPQPGDYWTVSTLEGPMLVGTLNQREGACQVMGSSPLGGVVMNMITSSLGELDKPFTVSDETGQDFGTPIHWRRFMSEDRQYIDVLHYKGVPGGMASTIHVIVG